MTCYDVSGRSAKPHLLRLLVNSAETVSDEWPLLIVALSNFDISVVICFRHSSPSPLSRTFFGGQYVLHLRGFRKSVTLF